MHERRAFVAALGAPGLATLSAPRLAQAAQHAGSTRIVFHEPSARGDMPVWLHRPVAWRAGGTIVAVLHGAGRNADGYRDAWAPLAEARNFLLVCPEFSQAAFPGAAGYNGGASQGVARPDWGFWALPRAVAAARRAVGDDATHPFHLYGHSAGSQFAHRYLWMCGAYGVARMAFANAGFYSWPDLARDYPYGLRGTHATPTDITLALARPVTILLGDADTDEHHPQLNRTPPAMLQGQHRLARGTNFFGAARSEAARLGVPFGWRLRLVPGVAHSNTGMAASAAATLLA